MPTARRLDLACTKADSRTTVRRIAGDHARSRSDRSTARATAPSVDTEYYLAAGLGFHGNDAHWQRWGAWPSVFNQLDCEDHDLDYLYQLAGEPGPVSDVPCPRSSR